MFEVNCPKCHNMVPLSLIADDRLCYKCHGQQASAEDVDLKMKMYDFAEIVQEIEEQTHQLSYYLHRYPPDQLFTAYEPSNMHIEANRIFSELKQVQDRLKHIIATMRPAKGKSNQQERLK